MFRIYKKFYIILFWIVLIYTLYGRSSIKVYPRTQINFTPNDSNLQETLADIKKLIDTSRKEQSRLAALLEILEKRNQANADFFNPSHAMNQSISECSCERSFFYPPNKRIFTLSSCSDEGTLHTTRQKVVTFSLYYGKKLDKKRAALYKEGIEANLKRMRKLYPGHTMRLYTDVTLEKDYCNFVCNNSDLFWCDIRKTPNLGDLSKMYYPTWRFLPLGDSTVEYFLSRDLDSVITEREAAVMEDWLKLNKSIHLMRDKAKAHNIPILAGLWGARNNLLGETTATKLRDQIIHESKVRRRYKGTDQSILSSVIFYPRRKDIVAYDSYHCKYWRKFTMVRPFPKRRMDNVSDFTGNYNLGRKKYKLLPRCPDECKPAYGKDWTFC